jgi:hypothetical protein
VTAKIVAVEIDTSGATPWPSIPQLLFAGRVTAPLPGTSRSTIVSRVSPMASASSSRSRREVAGGFRRGGRLGDKKRSGQRQYGRRDRPVGAWISVVTNWPQMLKER